MNSSEISRRASIGDSLENLIDAGCVVTVYRKKGGGDYIVVATTPTPAKSVAEKHVSLSQALQDAWDEVNWNM